MWGRLITELFKTHIETLFSYELAKDFESEVGEHFSVIDKTFDGNISDPNLYRRDVKHMLANLLNLIDVFCNPKM